MNGLTINIQSIKSCPFCKSKVCESVSKEDALGYQYQTVICKICNANGPSVYPESERFMKITKDRDIRRISAKAAAIEEWNCANREEED